MSFETVNESLIKLNRFRNEEIGAWINILVDASFRRGNRISNDVINIKEFISKIYQVYSSFKDEYNEKCTLNLGNDIIFESCGGKITRKLSLLVKGRQNKDSIIPWSLSSHFIIMERNHNYRSFLLTRNGLEYPIKADDDVFEGYLEVFGKYSPLFQFFNSFVLPISADHDRYIQISFDARNGSFINNLDGIIVSVFSKEANAIHYIVNTYVDLTDGIKINYDKSSMKIYKNDIREPDRRMYDEVLNSLYVGSNDLNYSILTSMDEVAQKRR